MLVVLTVLPGLFMSAPALPSWQLVVIALLGTYLASASASVFNHVIDSDVDGDMVRTKRRPIPSGAIPEPIAVGFGSILGLISFVLLYLGANPLTAWIALAANFFYVVVYTLWLKRRTTQNIVIGGAAGAVGPLIGWAAVTGGLSWQAWMLFAIIFMWTPPHFWALAIKYRDDYSRVNIPMLPSVKGVATTRRQIFAYTVLLIPICASLFIYGDAGAAYFIVSMVSSGYFCYLALRLLRKKDDEYAMPVFYFSLFYVFLIFGVLAIEQFIARA